MKREDFFTGEPLPGGSPTILQNEYTTEQEAISNASFGSYDYDPGTRMMNNSPIASIYPGSYGYNNFMNPPVSFNPYYGNNPGYYYGNLNYSNGGNPALALMQQQQMQQQQMYQQQIQYHIAPVNFGGSEFLPSAQHEEEIERLKLEYWAKEQEEYARNSMSSAYNPYTGYYNYYGTPYINPYQYNNSISNEVDRKIAEIKEEARENRLNFNMNLARLAHNIAGDDYDDRDLRERYEGKNVTGPMPITYGEIVEQNRFNNLVPVDNSKYYQEFHASVSREFNSVISKDSDLTETFSKMGELNAKYELEEEQHRRKNGALLYDSANNSYKYFVRAKAAERYAQSKGLSLVQQVNNSAEQLKSNMLNQYNTLSQSAKLCDDGSLTITCPFGSKAGSNYTVHNSMEAGYDTVKERFAQYLDSITGEIYLNSPNASDD